MCMYTVECMIFWSEARRSVPMTTRAASANSLWCTICPELLPSLLLLQALSGPWYVVVFVVVFVVVAVVAAVVVVVSVVTWYLTLTFFHFTFLHTFCQIFSRVFNQWKSFENRSQFGRDMTNSAMGCFYGIFLCISVYLTVCMWACLYVCLCFYRIVRHSGGSY